MRCNKLKKLFRNRCGGSVVFAVVMGLITLLTVSVLWYVFYPIVSGVQTIAQITPSTNAAAFSDLLMNVWVWIGVIMLIFVLAWVFSYTQKRDWESMYD